MTELGVFARVFPAGPPGVAAAIRAAGFTATQLNLAALGRATLDTTLTAGQARQISGTFTAAGVRIWGLSGTYNAIDPDERAPAAATGACRKVIARAPDLGAEVVTLCTGTQDPDNMWRAHPATPHRPRGTACAPRWMPSCLRQPGLRCGSASSRNPAT